MYVLYVCYFSEKPLLAIGGPGTGKSTVLSCIIDEVLKTVNANIIIATPCGK